MFVNRSTQRKAIAASERKLRRAMRRAVEHGEPLYLDPSIRKARRKARLMMWRWLDRTAPGKPGFFKRLKGGRREARRTWKGRRPR